MLTQATEKYRVLVINSRIINYILFILVNMLTQAIDQYTVLAINSRIINYNSYWLICNNIQFGSEYKENTPQKWLTTLSVINSQHMSEAQHGNVEMFSNI